MELLSKELITNSDGAVAFYIWVSNGYYYQSYTVTEKSETIAEKYLKSKYSDYEHFVGVMGKFNPYTVFFMPIPIKKLTFSDINAAEI